PPDEVVLVAGQPIAYHHHGVLVEPQGQADVLRRQVQRFGGGAAQQPDGRSQVGSAPVGVERRDHGRAGACRGELRVVDIGVRGDRKSTRLNSSHVSISYAVFCLKKKISKKLTI